MNDRHLAVVADRPPEDCAPAAPLDRALVVHVLGDADDAPRLTAVARALEATGAFAQVVLDAGDAASALADLGAPALVRRVEPEARSRAQRPAGLLDALGGELAAEAPAAVMLHAGDDAALAGALAAARRALPVVRVGRASGDAGRAERVIDSLADLRLVYGDDCAAALMRRGIDPDRIWAVGNPLADAVRRVGREAGKRRVWRSGGIVPGRYVLAVLTRPTAPPALARALAELEAPVVTDLSPALAAAWERAGVLAVPAEDRGFATRVSLARAAGAVVTDSPAFREAAELLGVECHPATAEAIAAARPRPRTRGARVVALWDGRAGERVADVMVENFARVRAG